MMNHPHQIYQATSVYTASRERLLLMIFEGAIRFCKESIQAVETKDFQLANEKINKVQCIINELMITLDRKVSKELTEGLLSLYDWMNRLLIQANLKKDAALLREVQGLLTELYEAFSEADKKIKGSQPK